MTLPIERARSRRPITWLTIVGIVLLPAIIGGILVAALYNPVERLDNMSAAIVNEDEAVTINDQLVPLGRQLTAGLVEGSDELASNLDWVISNKEDAAEGLADGTYQAIVTIPENFSAAATSTAPGSTPEQATIEVTTPPDAKIVDDAITAQVTSAAASIMGQQLSEVYLENVLLGFTTLGDQLGDAATGATQLADGATDAASGAQQLADGASEAATGAQSLADGASQAATGAQSLANGVPQLSSGATSLANGARDLSTGLTTISGKTREAAAGASQLAAGVNAGADQLIAAGIVPAELTAAADGSAAATAGVSQGLGALVATCDTVTNPDFCAQLAAVQAQADGAAQAAGGTSYGLGQLAAQAPQQIAGQLRTIGSNVSTLSGGLGQLADGIDQSAAGAGALSSGATQLAGGVDQVGAGASSLASGISTLANGTDGLASGISTLADGSGSLADGITTLADGTSSLADGLDEASTSIPSYSDSEAKSLATVVADPVAAAGNDTNLFGASAVPLLATLALWFGGFGSFIALQAVPRRALTSRAPSGLLALRTLAPAAGLGAVQGLLVAGVVQLAASYSWDLWVPFAFMSVVAGIAFAAINQALVAAFGGAGRWFAGLVGVLAVATGVVSTVPGVLTSVASLMPTTPAYSGMLAALTESAGFGAGIAGLLIWSVVAFIVTTIAVARRRVVQSRELLAISPIAA